MRLIHFMRKSKKILRSALVLVMTFLIATTTLTQAYASYASIKIEHAWVDETENTKDQEGNEESVPDDGVSESDNEAGEPETGDEADGADNAGADAEDNAEAPASDITLDDLNGKLQHEIESSHWAVSGTYGYGTVTEPETATATINTEKSGTELGSQINQKAGEAAAVELLEQLDKLQDLYNAIPEVPEEEVEWPGWEPDRYDYHDDSAYDQAWQEWDAAGREGEAPSYWDYLTPEYDTALAAWQAKNEAYTRYSEQKALHEKLTEDYGYLCGNLKDALREKWKEQYPDHKIELSDKFMDDEDFREALGKALGQEDSDGTLSHVFWETIEAALKNPDAYLPYKDAPEENYAEIKEQVKEQLETIEVPEGLDTVKAGELAGVIAEEISGRVDKVIGIDNVWQTGNIVSSLKESADTNPLKLTEESQKLIEDAGYTENSLKITIVVINGIPDLPDGNGNPEVEYRKTYVSTDNGASWTLVGITDKNGKDMGVAVLDLADDTEAMKTENPVGEGEVVESYLYTYLHVKPNLNPKPEDPKPEDPKPEDPRPEDPKPEDPRPEDPKPEDPKPEDPKPEDPKPEDPKPEDPRPEDPRPEDPRPEDPKPENPRPDPTPRPDPDPIEIREPDVPLAELPEEEVPLAEEPEEEPEEVEIPEDDVPLSEIPKTGDNSFLWMCAALVSGAALLILTRRKEEA